MSPNVRSRRTRRAILAAARSIVEDVGYDALTMGSVAERAGISRRGVYLHFPSVGALVAGLFDHVAEVEGLEQSLTGVWESPDSISALRAWAGHLASYHVRVMAIDEALRAVDATDRAAAAHLARVAEMQMASCSRLAQWLYDDGNLRRSWDVDSAGDLLYGLISTQLMARLLRDRGWTREQLEHRLGCLLQSTLVEPYVRPPD